MNPFDFLVGALAVLITVGIVYMLGLKPDPKPQKRRLIDKLDAERLEMEAEQARKEDGWIAELEQLVTTQKANLAILRAAPPVIENLNARGQAVVSIGAAERKLAQLYARRQPMQGDRRETAASHFEGLQ